MDRKETITLAGNLGAEDQQKQYRLLLDKIWESGAENLEIDLSGVNKLDFNSLTELLKTRNRFLQAGTTVEFRNIPDHIRRILEIFKVRIAKND